jgi:hypothetical protein
MSAISLPAAARAGRREYLSERGQMGLLLVAVVVFAMSVAAALAFASTRAHRSAAAYQGWHDTRAVHALKTAPLEITPGAQVTIASPSSPTTSA